MRRACLDCGTLFVGRGSRCVGCERKGQRIRNRMPARQKYRGSWPAESRAIRARDGACMGCGTTVDLTADHTTGLTFCRVCHRPEAQGGARMGGGHPTRASDASPYVPAPTDTHTLGNR